MKKNSARKNHWKESKALKFTLNFFRQSFFYLGGQVENYDYIAALERESEAKNLSRATSRSRIGF